MKKSVLLTLIIIGIIVLAIAWYLISPAFKTIEADEESPLVIRDSMLTMTDEEKAEFNSAVDKMKDEVKEMSENMPPNVEIIAEGNFIERAHEVEGKALLINDNGKLILRFEDFETINGPDLHIYLASNLGDDNYIDLGKIKATKGNVNYEIPVGTDTTKYNKVLVWCEPFRVLFSYAELE